MKKVTFCLFFLFFGCAHTVKTVSVNYQVFDNPDQRNIELTFQNSYAFGVCITPERWPNLLGEINAASDVVFLVVNGEKYYMKNFNTGYCPGCATLVAEGETISAVIPYSNFELPVELYELKKVLIFSSTAEKFSPRYKKCH